MFAIASPQTVTLAGRPKDTPPISVVFHTDGDEVSRCVMDVMLPNGDVHTAVFNTRGQMVAQSLALAEDAEAKDAEAKAAEGDDTDPNAKPTDGSPKAMEKPVDDPVF